MIDTPAPSHRTGRSVVLVINNLQGEDLAKLSMEIATGSDRSVVIVGGSLIEHQLEEFIKAWMIQDRKIEEEMFRPSGPLGSFSSKINLARLMGLISSEAFRDLATLKSIRNDFAHDLSVESFSRQSVADRCRNFTLADRYSAPQPSGGELAADLSAEHRMKPPREWRTRTWCRNHAEDIVDPKGRFIIELQVRCYGLQIRSGDRPYF